MESNSKKNRVKRIFDSISHRYDLLNHLLSLGIDFYWRKKSLKLTGIKANASLLDVACGTGDFAIAAEKTGIREIVGADLSLNMLKIFNRKSSRIKGSTVQCVAEFLPFKEKTFTNITVAFGVRNFYDIKKGFESFRRVLQEGGKATVLEFRLPSNRVIKGIYLLYFNRILPLIGRILSKDREAYTYLPESVHEFDESTDIEKLLLEAGFRKVDKFALTFGIVQVLVAEK